MNSGAAGLRKGKRHGTSRGSAEYGLLDDEQSKPSSSGGNGTRQCSASLSLHDIVIGSTVAITVLVWVGFGLVESVFGNIGLVALFPILVFGAMGYLSREDFNGECRAVYVCVCVWCVTDSAGGCYPLSRALDLLQVCHGTP